MFGQGNYPPRFGQGSITPMPTFQQRPVATPSPPFHQGPPASQPSTTQQAPPSVAPHVGYSGHFIYQHAPTPPVQQVSRVQLPTSGMLNAGQSILPPPPPPPPPPLPPQQVHGSTSVAHSRPTAQHNSQWIQTMHHATPPVPPPFGQPPTGPNRPEMFQPSIPPRALPILPSQGQIPYRGLVHLPQSGTMHGSQQIPLPPAVSQPTSSFFTPVPFGSFLAPQNSNVLAMGPPPPPPPPPSSPPPLPPSPPPPNSPHPSFGILSSTPPRPTLPLTASDLSHNSESDPTSSCSGFEVMAPDSVNKVVVTTQIRDNAPAHDNFTNPECKSSCEVGSPMEDDLSSVEGMKLDISPPPSKPAEEKVVQQIEIMCDLIAKNGPGFEDMVRQKECTNPEFEFLFGGEPGSEAAVAHQYFEWMKRKYIFSVRLQHRHSSSASRPSDMDTATQTKSLRGATAPPSPSDSDMDMEDDITQPDEVQRVYNSFEGLNRDTVLMPKELDFQEQLRTEQNAVECKLAKDISGSSGRAEQKQNAVDDSLPKDAISGSSGLAEQEKISKLFLDHSRFTYGRSLFKVDSSVKNSSGTAECPSNSDLEKSFVPPLEDLSQSNLSAAAAVIGFEKVPGELIKGASPFRLLQDYASDDSSGDDEKPCLEDVSPVTASPSTTAGAKGLHEDIGSNLLIHPGSKSLSSSEMAFGILSESVVASSQSMPSNDLEFLPESQRTSREVNMTSIATVKAEEPVDINNGNQELVDKAVFPEALKQEDALVGVRDATRWSTKSQTQKEDIEYTSALPKVDEFGRLVREGASDSDSDDTHNTGRHSKRRRSRSHSRSPHDRRRSPWRRKENQSRSRGLSPKRRRSRSRSPSYRRGGESGGDKMRMDKGQLPQCYNFLQGRCHHGAFCRYMHHDSHKSDVARRYKSKQHYVEVPPVSETTDFNEDIIKKIPPKRTVHEQDVPGSSFSALEGGDMDKEKVFVIVQDTVQTLTSDQDDKSLVPDVAKSERSRELTAIVEETPDIKEEILESPAELPNNINCLKLVELVQPVEGSPSCLLTDAGVPKSPGVTSHGIASLNENSVIMHSQVNSSLPVLQKVDHQPQHADSSDSLLIQGSTAFQNQLPVCESHLSKISSVQSYPVDFLDRHSQLSPPPLSLSQGTSTSSPKLPREMVQSTSKVSSLSPPMENCPPYQAPLQKQHSHVTEPSSSSWYLPPPPPLPPQLPLVNNFSVTAVTAMQSVPSLHFQQNQLPPRNDFTLQTFVTPYPREMLNHSQLSDFQHRSYPLMQVKEPPRPSLHMEDFRQKPLPMTMSNPMSQPFGGLGLVGENQLSQFPVQGINPPKSSAQGNIHLQPGPSLRDSAARIMLPFRGDDLPSDEFSTASSQKHPYSQQQRSLYGIQQSAVHGLSENLGDHENISSTMSRYTSDLERNQASHLSDFGGSRISNHYNPFASTFDQPLRSKFSSNSFKQDMAVPYINPYDATYRLSHLPVDGPGVGSLGSRHMATMPKSSRAIDLPRSSSDQYDPIFDSIEPSSNSFKKFDHGIGQELPLDVEENNKKKEVEAVAVTTSIKSENDEYGETEDAEVGDVENLSASNPLDEANTGVGEIEIDQVKTPGKSKKSKDSRSMKLFKVALADFVKEVLKPSWRQGNMSKEAFKTIVKKTVDKVSGAMKSHQLPKSQAKINRYIDSSQRKLTKLVMGYVQKYAKG